MTLTYSFLGITLLLAVVTFLVVIRGRGILSALGASLLALLIFGAAYLALASIIVKSM